MNEGVKILLERMKTNPEEFIGEGNPYLVGSKQSKWSSLIAQFEGHLSVEDQEELRTELDKLHQERFTQEIMKELLAPEDDSL